MISKHTLKQNSCESLLKLNYQFDHHFTIEEVNTIIPRLSMVLIEIREMLKASSSNKKLGNMGIYSSYSQMELETGALKLLRQLQDSGIVIQDVSRGLIDFPCILGGSEVFLCYELADGNSIGHYHDIHAGYAGRKKLENF